MITPDERRVKEIINNMTHHGNMNCCTKKKKLTGRPSRSSEERDSGTMHVSLLDVDITCVGEEKNVWFMYGACVEYVYAWMGVER